MNEERNELNQVNGSVCSNCEFWQSNPKREEPHPDSGWCPLNWWHCDGHSTCESHSQNGERRHE